METLEVVKNLGQFLVNQGGRPYLVGGCVRDELMGKTPKDYDIEVFQLSEIFLETQLRVFTNRFDLKLDAV